MKGRPRKKLTARTSTSNNNPEEDSLSPPDSDPNTEQSANNCDKVRLFIYGVLELLHYSMKNYTRIILFPFL